MAEERTVHIDAVHLDADPDADPPFWYRQLFAGDTNRSLADLLTEAAQALGTVKEGDECGQVEVTVYLPGVWAVTNDPHRVWATNDGKTWWDKQTGIDYNPDKHR